VTGQPLRLPVIPINNLDNLLCRVRHIFL
jgi:hypothetical protein